MTGKLHVTLPALAGKRTVLQTAELLLLLTIKHVDERMVMDVAQLILRKNEVVAGINIAIVLHHSCMTAFLGISTDAGRNIHPVCQRAVENLNEDFAHILPYPLIEIAQRKLPHCSGVTDASLSGISFLSARLAGYGHPHVGSVAQR